MSGRVQIDQLHRESYRRQIRVAQQVRETAAEVGLSRILVELVQLRASQLNGCGACLDAHVHDALQAGETVQRIGVLPAWRNAGELFTPVERAALRLTELVTRMPERAVMEAEYQQASADLTAEQVSAICWIAIAINSFNRISVLCDHPVPVRTAAD